MISRLKNFISTNFVDKDFRVNYKYYIFQSSLIFICIFLILLLCNFFNVIIVASLGASSFILFAIPHTNNARVKYVIGGYFWGLILGSLFNFLYYKISSLNFAGIEYALMAVCAASVAVTMFFMVITNLSHPPAAALALGLSTDSECFKTTVSAIIGVIIICTVRQILKKYLKNLI